MKKVTVIIPFMSSGHLINLLDILLENSVEPARILLIDNSRGACFKDIAAYLKSPSYVSYFVNDSKLTSVNASWNLGFRIVLDVFKDTDIVSVLNDDLVITKDFIKGVIDAFEELDDAGVVCPNTAVPLSIKSSGCVSIKESEVITWLRERSNESGLKYQRMPRRQGWAYSIDSKLLKNIPAIPEELKTFCGDDWIYYWTHKLGKNWYKMLRTVVFHYAGSTVRLFPEVRNTLKKEKGIFQKLIKEQNV